MTIENIQKKRFLDTIYKIYYSLGSEPSINEISTIYGRYFSRFKPGQPIPAPYQDLSASAVIDHEKLNRILAHTTFNIDVLYDSFYEEIEELYATISAFKFRMDNLRSRRAELEKTVDDHLFAINNTNGYYYSHTNAFNNTNLTDLQNTSAVVDTAARKLTLPKITSGLFNYVGNVLNKTSNATIELFLDGKEVKSQTGVDFSNVFNGLNNSEWTFTHESPTIGVYTLKITVPISSSGATSAGISLVEGKVNSQKPVEISTLVVDSFDRSKSLFFSKDSSRDYDNFSFSFATKPASAVEIYLTKVEPDYTSSLNDSVRYVYDFRIEELIITAPYYDASAMFVSQRIAMPTLQNPNLAIDEIVFDTVDQVPAGSAINYYIAADDGTPKLASDFSWIAISPASMKNASNKSVVKFGGVKRNEAKLIDIVGSSLESSAYEMIKIPRTTEYNNPISGYFYSNDPTSINFNLYRLAKFQKNISPYDVYMLENVDSNQISASIVSGTSMDRTTWQEVLSGKRKDIVPTKVSYSVGDSEVFYQAQNVAYGSIYLTTNIYLDESYTITKNFLKSLSAQFWDIKIYLNGVELTGSGSLAPGILTSSLTWNFKTGQNSIVIIINKSTNDTSGIETTFNGSISLMEGISLADIPNSEIYKNYLSYVKIEDLRNKYSNIDNVFSIINWENNTEIVYRRTEEIKTGSKVYYLVNDSAKPNGVRVRADLIRGNDSYTAPVVLSYTLKFKN
jgi:hypothetical protein